MSLIDAFVLGLIQGLFEFIPVSSSGHLILTSQALGVDSSFDFDVLINLGTVVAAIWYFRDRLIKIITDFISQRNNKLFWAIIVSTVPVAVVGGAWLDLFNTDLMRSSTTVAFMLILVGVFMVFVDKIRLTQKDISQINVIDALSIGFAQVLALIPGTSRSGITILAGRLRGLNYRSAAEFSFLLSVPVILGAILRVLIKPEAQQYIADNPAPLLVGCLTAFISGVFAIDFTIKTVSKLGLRPFGIYRILLGIVVLILV